ncbi:MAG: hypothetical protein K0U74_02845 [Alphaproteobacteria bacterium]|nr:hypothetical protein [Alphaproteobacteria bacterium]
MATNGTLRYGMKPTPVLGKNMCSYNAVFTLKQDDPDAHAAALVEILNSDEVLNQFQETQMIHIIGFYRISRDKVFVQSNFDGGDVVDYWEVILNSNPALVDKALQHLEGFPGMEAGVTAMAEFLGSGQADVDVVSYYCAAPTVTINQLYRDADWRNKVMDLQKSLAQPAGRPVKGETASSL